MAKMRTKKITASMLEPGMVVIIPAQRGVVKECLDVNEKIPSLSKCILWVELEGCGNGPWKGQAGKTLILDNEQVDIEVKPGRLRKFMAWMFEL